jgi:hypothetical protein
MTVSRSPSGSRCGSDSADIVDVPARSTPAPLPDTGVGSAGPGSVAARMRQMAASLRNRYDLGSLTGLSLPFLLTHSVEPPDPQLQSGWAPHGAEGAE